MEERHTDAISEVLEGNGGLTDKIEDTALGLATVSYTHLTLPTKLEV